MYHCEHRCARERRCRYRAFGEFRVVLSLWDCAALLGAGSEVMGVVVSRALSASCCLKRNKRQEVGLCDDVVGRSTFGCSGSSESCLMGYVDGSG